MNVAPLVSVRATEQASRADRAYFAAHPDAIERIRAPLPGELPVGFTPPAGQVVRVHVRVVGPGARVRTFTFGASA